MYQSAVWIELNVCGDLLKASFNMLIGCDWIHAVGAIPSTLHPKFIMWSEDRKIEEIAIDNNPCYLHVDFIVYNLKVKPIDIDVITFDPTLISECQIRRDGFYLMPNGVGRINLQKNLDHGVIEPISSIIPLL